MELNEIIHQVFGPLIIALMSAAVGFIRKISMDVKELTISSREFRLEILHIHDGLDKVNDKLQDHQEELEKVSETIQEHALILKTFRRD